MNFLVTGANGFVGRALCSRLLREPGKVLGAVWREDIGTGVPSGVNVVQVDGLGGGTDWGKALAGIDTVIHLAARVHVMADGTADPLAEYRKINVEGTANLARQAAKYGVSRFVFLSSVKAVGESGSLSSNTEVSPSDPYGVSKLEAESVLKTISSETGIQVVVLRSPLVYGPGVKANFLRLMQLVNLGLPLPLGSISNKRSLVYVGNLADAIAACSVHPSAGGYSFFVSDGEDLSTTDLLRHLIKALNSKTVLFSFPAAVIKLLAWILGRKPEADRLLESLVVDISEIRSVIGWEPPFKVDVALSETAVWFNNQRSAA